MSSRKYDLSNPGGGGAALVSGSTVIGSISIAGFGFVVDIVMVGVGGGVDAM
jgi:hypothetical protein